MPFGKKKDLLSGVLIDFDAIYNTGIKPAIEDVGLRAERGDQEQSGGIIHLPMFARILLSDFMVADLTLGNPNVFYELGIRHLAKPFTTVPIFATTSALPFDVASVRSIGYDLKEGVMEAESAAKLRRNVAERLRISMQQAAKPDSPIYDLINALPPPAIPETVEPLPAGVVPAPGTVMATLVATNRFGFMTMERDGARWQIVAHDTRGMPQINCTLEERQASCVGSVNGP